jgi:hypothetical protein
VFARQDNCTSSLDVLWDSIRHLDVQTLDSHEIGAGGTTSELNQLEGRKVPCTLSSENIILSVMNMRSTHEHNIFRGVAADVGRSRAQAQNALLLSDFNGQFALAHKLHLSTPI